MKTPPWMMEVWVGKTFWRRAWQPTPVFLLGKSHGQRSLAGYCSWGPKKWDMTKATQFSSSGMSNSLRHLGLGQAKASLSITNSWNWLKLISIQLVMPSNHVILCRPLLLLPSIFASIRVFSSESVLRIRWPKYWSLGLISFRIDWLDLLAVQGTLRSLLQHQFKNISSLALSFLYSSTLTSINDYWKNRSLD